MTHVIVNITLTTNCIAKLRYYTEKHALSRIRLMLIPIRCGYDAHCTRHRLHAARPWIWIWCAYIYIYYVCQTCQNFGLSSGFQTNLHLRVIFYNVSCQTKTKSCTSYPTNPTYAMSKKQTNCLDCSDRFACVLCICQDFKIFMLFERIQNILQQSAVQIWPIQNAICGVGLAPLNKNSTQWNQALNSKEINTH